jgi:hypothetical protein
MHLLKNNNNNNNLSVFVDPDSEACELIGDPELSVISMRHKRSFSETVKVANFSSNEGSD